MPDLSDLLDDLAGPPGASEPENVRDRVRQRCRHRRIARAGTAIAVIAIVGAVALVAAALRDDGTATVIADGDNSTSGPSTILAGRDFTVLAMIVPSRDPIGTLRSVSSQTEVESLRRAIGLATELRLRGNEVVVSITIAVDDCPDKLTSFERSGEVLTPAFEPRTGCGNPLSPMTYVVALDPAESLRPTFTLRLPADPPHHDDRRLLVEVPPPTTSAPSTSATKTRVPEEEVVTPGDRSVAEALAAFADSPNPETFAAVPLAEQVALGAGDRLLETRSRAALAEPSEWVLDINGMWGRSRTTSPLDLLAARHSTVVRVGPHPHCASPPTSPPPEVDGQRRVSITPTDVDSCLLWFSVDLYLDAHSQIVAVTVDLWDP